MALPATDNFNRADAGTLGANWTDQLNGYSIHVNAAEPETGSADNAAYWSADSFGADHYSQIKLTTIQDGGPTVRIAGVGAGTVDGYLLSCQAAATTIQRLDNDTGTILQSGLAVFSNGDTAKLQIVGTTLKAYKNGAQIGSDQADATYASGSAGMYNYSSSAVFDDFEADNISSGPRYILGSH